VYGLGEKSLSRINNMEPNQSIVDRVIQMAWEDRTTFDAIQSQFGLNESAVIKLMRTSMKASSFKMWRARVTGRKSKHLALRHPDISRFTSGDQKNRDF
jgi:uncharacterized protein (TIGR03643 family)